MKIADFYKTVAFPYGAGRIEVKIPKRNLLQHLKAKDPPPLSGETGKIKSALLNPIKVKPLHEVVKPGSKLVILVSDVTRPVPTHKLLPPILNELRKVAVTSEDVVIVVATGLHRKNTKAELELMLGSRIVRDVRVVNHDAFDKRKLVYVGETSRGTLLEINSLVPNFDVRILTGYIEPHEFAGFTGDGKSILPGVSGMDTINRNHSLEMLDHPKSRVGVLEGNPIHEDIVEAARMVGVDFITNVVLNSKKEIAKVVAGDLVEAHRAGVKFNERYASLEVGRKADIVITSSGYPLDIDFYQSVKSLVAAEPFVAEGGAIILLAECKIGIGPHLFYSWMRTCSSPDQIMERIRIEGYNAEIDHCYLLARILRKCDIVVVSSHPHVNKIGRKFIKTAKSAEEALDAELRKRDGKADIVALPHAPRIIPKLTSIH